MTLVQHTAGGPEAIARGLAEAYQSRLEAPVTGDGTFLIELSAAAARLLARDPHVARVEPLAVGTPWSLGPYQYDHAGNIKEIGSSRFVYDAEARLSYEKTESGKQQALTYDGFGNIRTITEGSAAYTVGANPSSNRADVPSAATNHLSGTYDPAGNMVTSGTSTYVYDALNVLTRSTTDVSRAYVYNASDERVGVVTLTGPNGSEVSSQWTIRDPAGQVLRRFMRQGSQWRWMQDYVYRNGKMLASESNDQIKILHYHLDHLGTPRLITGNGGVEVARHTYYPFGAEVPGPSPQILEPKKFTGHERDSGGLDYMHARYYSHGMGRFLSIDPVMDIEKATREPQSWNRYSYVTNNPLTYMDPDGREKTIYFLGGLLHRWTAYEEVSDLRGFVKSQAGYSLNVDSQMSRTEVLRGLRNLDSTDIAVLNVHSWDLNLQTERGATGRETFTASTIVSAFNKGGNPQALVLAGCGSANIAQFVANKTGVVTFGTTARTQSREVGFAATVLATVYAKTGNAALAVKVANAILQKGACGRDSPVCSPERPRFVYFNPEKQK